MVSVSASVNLPLHHKVQKFSSGTGSPGWSRKKGRKTVVVFFLFFLFMQPAEKQLYDVHSLQFLPFALSCLLLFFWMPHTFLFQLNHWVCSIFTFLLLVFQYTLQKAIVHKNISKPATFLAPNNVQDILVSFALCSTSAYVTLSFQLTRSILLQSTFKGLKPLPVS